MFFPLISVPYFFFVAVVSEKEIADKAPLFSELPVSKQKAIRFLSYVCPEMLSKDWLKLKVEPSQGVHGLPQTTVARLSDSDSSHLDGSVNASGTDLQENTRRNEHVNDMHNSVHQLQPLTNITSKSPAHTTFAICIYTWN